MDLTPDHIESLMKNISKLEEDYGIIGKQVDEYKIAKKKSSITVTPDNIDKVSPALQNLADISNSLHKKRKF